MKNIKIWMSGVCLIFLSSCTTVSPTETYRHQSAQQIHKTAKSYLADHDYAEAAKAYEALDALHPFHANAQESQYQIIEAYQGAEDYASAVAAADHYIHLYPHGTYAAHAYLLKGEATMNQDRAWFLRYLPVDASSRDLTHEQEALKAFSIVVREFPKSPYAAEAAKYVRLIQQHTVQAELNVARYYLRRHAYIAAANRATYLLQHYPNSSYTRDALQVLVEANHRLGLTEAEAQAKARLEAGR